MLINFQTTQKLLILLWTNRNRSIVRLSMRHRTRTSDYIIGTVLGIIFVVIVGKLWLVPWMSVWDILKVIVRSQVGWW